MISLEWKLPGWLPNSQFTSCEVFCAKSVSKVLLAVAGRVAHPHSLVTLCSLPLARNSNDTEVTFPPRAALAEHSAHTDHVWWSQRETQPQKVPQQSSTLLLFQWRQGKIVIRRESLWQPSIQRGFFYLKDYFFVVSFQNLVSQESGCWKNRDLGDSSVILCRWLSTLSTYKCGIKFHIKVST